MTLKALIVDDEQLARDELQYLLTSIEDVEVVAQGKNGIEAIDLVPRLEPDVVFLDVQMPGMDGFDVLRTLSKEDVPGVIFLTAYEQHALRAFEVHALDYLLKPVDDERFAAALDRARRHIDSSEKTRAAERILAMLGQNAGKYATRFAVRTGTRIQIVLVEDIEWIGAAGDYAEFHVGGRSHLLRETMSALEQKLDPAKFIRIHRSRIVRSSSVNELRSIDNREYVVKLNDGSEHRSSRTYADRLDAWLSATKR